MANQTSIEIESIGDVKAGEIRKQLVCILESPQFRNSARLQRFLQFAVACALEGTTDQLKESVLGRVVFDRGSHFDPRTDSIVRVESQRLRKRLGEYYEREAANDTVLIAFRAGSYVPAFSYTGHKNILSTGGHDIPARKLNPETIAVLPFSNLSSDPEQEYFCDGITEDIIHALSRITGLSVIGRTSMFALKGTIQDLHETGVRLGAGTIVSGSVRRSGERLRISAQMCEAESGQVRWSDTFDRILGDLFTVEAEIAQSIARVSQMVLAPPLSRRLIRGAPNMDAYLMYLRGRHEWNKMTTQGLHEAVGIFAQTILLYPEYASPRAALADAYSSLAMWGGAKPGDAFTKAEKAAREALRLDPYLPHAYSSAAASVTFYHRRWADGTAMALKATELEPSDSFARHIYGACLLAGGHANKSHTQLEAAVSLDPLSARAHRTLGWALYLRRRFGGAEQWLRAALQIHAEPSQTHYLLGRLLLVERRFPEALQQAELAQSDPVDPLTLGLLGACLAHTNHREQSLQTLSKMERISEGGVYVDPFALAEVHLALGETDLALENVRQSLEERTPAAVFFGIDPEFDPLRTKPRFNELVAGLGA